jgi:hypothetical protein
VHRVKKILASPLGGEGVAEHFTGFFFRGLVLVLFVSRRASSSCWL